MSTVNNWVLYLIPVWILAAVVLVTLISALAYSVFLGRKNHEELKSFATDWIQPNLNQ